MLFFVFAPQGWPEPLSARIVLVVVPLAAWVLAHGSLWWAMRATLRRFRCGHQRGKLDVRAS